MNVQYINLIMNNPILLSKILTAFLTGYGDSVDFKTLFYVLPIVMCGDSRERLNHTNKSSTLYSVFSKENEFSEYESKLNTRFCLNQVNELYSQYLKLTKQSLIVLANQGDIYIDEKVHRIKSLDFTKISKSIREYFKAAYYLGIILAEIEINEFENFLEIKEEVKD